MGDKQSEFLTSESSWAWTIESENYQRQQGRLISLGSVSNWNSQDGLRAIEDSLARQFWVNVFEYPVEDWQIARYLALTSLPFVINLYEKEEWIEYGCFDTFLMLRAGEYREKLRLLWQLEYPRVEKIGDLIRRPTMPTGNMRGKYMIIGSAPGVHTGAFLDDHFDRVFVYGPSSHFLRKALLLLKIYNDCWFTNVIKLATENNRPVTKFEAAEYKWQLDNEIEMIEPDVIILLGRNVQDVFEFPIDYHKKKICVVNIYHPSYAMQQGRGNMNFQQYAQHIQERAKEVGVVI